jgi:hypothetical protein
VRRQTAALGAVLLAALTAGAALSTGTQPAPTGASTPSLVAAAVPTAQSSTTAPVPTAQGSTAASTAPAPIDPAGSPPLTPTPGPSSPSPTLPSSPPESSPTPSPPSEPAGSSNRSSYLLDATYSVHVHVNWAAGSLDVTTNMEASNASGGAITRLELNTIAARLGSMRLLEATVDGTDVAPRVSDQTIILRLPHALPNNGHASIHTRYRATLRNSFVGSDWLWSQRDGAAAVYRFIPWLSNRTAFDRPNHGDPFVTPVASNVRVRFTSSVPLVFATSGSRIASTQPGITYGADDVRDFSFTAARTYSVLNGRTLDGDAQIRVMTRWASRSRARHMLDVAQRVIARYEHQVGQLPYPSITIAETAGGSAMESPGAIWLPRGVANLDYLIAHELGHQWFYGVVGNDQANQPFFDEAMTDFLARTFMGQLRGSRCSTARLDLSIYAYSASCYYETIYIQGSRFLDDIRRDIGSGVFWTTVRSFWADNRFTVSSTFALLEAFRAAGGNALLPRYRQRFPSLYPS